MSMLEHRFQDLTGSNESACARPEGLEGLSGFYAFVMALMLFLAVEIRVLQAFGASLVDAILIASGTDVLLTVPGF